MVTPPTLGHTTQQEFNAPNLKTRLRRESMVVMILLTMASLAILLVLSITVFIVIRTGDFALNPRRLWDVFTGMNWNPTESFETGHFGSLPLLYGTLLVTLVASIGIPIGICMGIFLAYVAPPKLRNVLKPIIETIAVFPSVVIGLFAIMYVSPLVRDTTGANTGFVALTASMMLAWMVTPLMASLTDDAIRSVPDQITSSSIALGATRWETLKNLVLPEAKPSIIAAAVLSIGRIMGETMVVLMVTGNKPQISDPPGNILTGIYALPAAIALEHGDSPFGSAEYQVLFALALELLIISFILTALSRRIVGSPELTAKISKPFSWIIIGILFVPKYLLEITKKQAAKISTATRSFTKKQPSSTDEHQEMELAAERRTKIRRIRQQLVFSIMFLITIAVISLVFLLPALLMKDGWNSLTNWETYFSSPKYSKIKQGTWGLFPFIIGTVLVISAAALVALPISTATAVYLKHFPHGKRFTGAIKDSLQNLASLPSVVVGLFGFGLFVITFGWQHSILAGGMTLGIMMIPIAVTTTLEALDQVPEYPQEAAIALGATKWEAVKSHNIRYAMSNIITGYILAVARVVGETAPIMLTVAVMPVSSKVFPSSIVGEGVGMLPFLIYQMQGFFTSPYRMEWAAAASVILLAIAVSLNLVGHKLRNALSVDYGSV